MKKYFCSVFLVAIMFLIFSAAVSAEPEIFESIETYKVQGIDENSLRSSLNTNSPCKQDGKVFDAFTTWFVKWNFNWHYKDGVYCISSARSNVEVKFVLPEWENYSEASPKLKTKWDTYMKALKEHEDGHRNLGVEASKAVLSAIKNVPHRSSGEQIKIAANATANRVLENYRAQEREYDRRTGHGAKTGAIFP